jgi:hypothetical protein
MPGDGNGQGAKGGETVLSEASKQVLSKLGVTSIEELAKKYEENTSARTEDARKLEGYEKELLSQDYLDFLGNRKGGGGKDDAGVGKGKDGKAGDDDTPPDFENMTTGQLAKYMDARLTKTLGTLTQKVGETLKEYDERVGKAFAEIDVALTAVKYKDFGDALSTKPDKRTAEQKELVSRVHKVSTDNPNFSTERCVIEAKRALKEEADAKAVEEKAAAEADSKALSEKGGAAATALIEKGLPKEEAASKAWDSTFGAKEKVG